MFGTFDRSKKGVYNWSGTNLLANHNQIMSPRSEEEIIEILKRPNIKIRMIGSGLSYEPLNRVDQQDHVLMTLENYRGFISETEDTVTFRAGTALQEVFGYLIKQNKMLPSSPGVIGIQTLAGAIATGTHGQGMKQATLGDTIEKLKVITAAGEILNLDRRSEHFGAFLMHYGSLGVVVEVTFRTIPMEILACKKITTNFDTLCSVYSQMNEKSDYAKAWWFPESDDVHIWDVNKASEEEQELYQQNNRELTQISQQTDNQLNEAIDQIILKMSYETCDDKFEGRQFETVQRFKSVTNVVGDIYQVFCKGIPVPQINCEIAVPFEQITEVLHALRDWYRKSEHKPHYPFILRCTGASEAYLSGSYNRRVCWVGFLVYLAKDGSFIKGSLEMMKELQIILAKFQGVPHLGKHFIKEIFDFEANLPKWNTFKQLRKQYDPSGKFENEYLKNLFA
ncbi:hypothetical protein ABPG72_015473 [Tetrahymena utriculariae]